MRRAEAIKIIREENERIKEERAERRNALLLFGVLILVVVIGIAWGFWILFLYSEGNINGYLATSGLLNLILGGSFCWALMILWDKMKSKDEFRYDRIEK